MKIKLSGIFILLLFLSIPVLTNAQDELAVYSGVYLYDNPDLDSVVLAEFPFSINRDQLEFYQKDSSEDKRYHARVFAQLDIIGIDGYKVDSVQTYFALVANSLEETKIQDYRIFNKLNILLKPGIYTANLTIIDVVSKLEGSFFIDKVTVVPPKKNAISLSDFESAYNINYVGEYENSKKPELYKNGFDIIPNPLSVYTLTDSVINIYGEIYNLKYDPTSPTKYQLIINILDNFKNKLMPLGSRVKTKGGNTAVIVEKIPLVEWSQLGHFKIEIIGIDLETKAADTSYLPVHIISPYEVQMAAAKEKKDNILAAVNDPYNNLPLKDKVRLVKYMLNDDESSVLNSLNDSAKLNYLDYFWKEHDENPATGFNETRAEMIKRYKYSNEYFSTNDMKTDGYATDRGKIYMIFGPWTERDDHEAPRVGNPFEIWYYRNIEAGYVFVFNDWSGNDDYRIIHSTAPGYTFSREWEERLRSGELERLE